MILSHFAFPLEETSDKRNLYYRGEAGSVTQEGLELLPEASIRFDTYFNAFFLWRICGTYQRAKCLRLPDYNWRHQNSAVHLG